MTCNIYKAITLLLVVTQPLSAFCQGTWTWMRGSQVQNPVYNFGTLGVSSPANDPPHLLMPFTWTAKDGTLWMYGGDHIAQGSGIGSNGAQSMWQYDHLTNEWTWRHGPNTISAGSPAYLGQFGTLGTFAPANTPGPRIGQHQWVDTSGKLWMFGGYGYGDRPRDLWQYDVAINQWACMKGTVAPAYALYGTMNVYNTANTPGRSEGVAWMDVKNNELVLYPANGFSSAAQGNTPGRLSTIWKYRIATNEWAWVTGDIQLNNPVVYGTNNVPSLATNPSGQTGWATSYDNNAFTDTLGNYWYYYGGNNMWKYEPPTDMWTWVSPVPYETDTTRLVSALCDPSDQNIPGRMYPGNTDGIVGYIHWTDECGRMWLYLPRRIMGSRGLWVFDPYNYSWTKVWGGGTQVGATYGTMGIAAPANDPGVRRFPAVWRNERGLWMFGGMTLTPNNAGKNDLWLYEPEPPVADFSFTVDMSSCPWKGVFTNATTSGCGNEIKDYKWHFDDPASGADNVSTDKDPEHAFSANGTYDVMLVAKGCLGLPDTMIKQVIVNMPPGMGSFTVTDSVSNPGCTGIATAILTVTGNSGPYTFTWQPPGGTITNTSTESTATGLDTGTYVVTITDASGCSMNDTITVQQGTISDIDITYHVENVQCKNLGAVYVIAKGEYPPFTFSWEGKGTQVVNTDTSSFVPELPPGNYTVTITDSLGCKAYDTVTVVDNSYPIVITAPTELLSIDGQPVEIITSIKPPGIYEYKWIPTTALNCTNCPNVTATTLEDIIYTVRAVDSNGCYDTTSVTVLVDYTPFFVPTVFSPNGDGKNDLFGVFGSMKGIKLLGLSVFNRWGEQVFFSRDIDTRWNGYYKGKPMDIGTYMYVIEYYSKKEKLQKMLKGDITLVR